MSDQQKNQVGKSDQQTTWFMFINIEQIAQFTAVLRGGFLCERAGTRDFVTYW